MSDLTIKYNLLDRTSKKEVRDFMEFLLSKKSPSSPSKMDAYKKKILNVSKWNDADIELINQNQKKFNQWKIQEW